MHFYSKIWTLSSSNVRTEHYHFKQEYHEKKIAGSNTFPLFFQDFFMLINRLSCPNKVSSCAEHPIDLKK